MNEVKYTAILLKATDYHENDKLVRLLTLEGGLVSAVMKGVKKPNAKLKFGAMSFAFCEYVLAQGKGAYYTVTACSPIGDLYDIACDPDKYMVGSLILEASDIASYGAACPQLFALLLQALKALCYTSVMPNLIAAQYILKTTDLLGYKAEYFFTGNLLPQNLSDTLAALSAIETDDLQTLTVDPSLAYRALKMQVGRFQNKLDIKLNSIKYIM